MAAQAPSAPPDMVTQAILVKSEPVPDGTPKVQGYDFNKGLDYSALLDSYKTIGFQATHFGRAVEEINRMRAWRLSDDPVLETDDDDLNQVNDEEDILVASGNSSDEDSVQEPIAFIFEG